MKKKHKNNGKYAWKISHQMLALLPKSPHNKKEVVKNTKIA
jgi:hypothetical protein